MQPLRIGIDATALLGRRTGVGVFTHELLTRLATEPEFDLCVFAITWRGRRQLPDHTPDGVRIIETPMPARPLRALWKRVDWPPIQHWTGEIDLVHGPNFVVPPAGRTPQIVSVHDLTPVRFPELCTKDTLAYPSLIARAVTRGAWIHTGSHFVANEIREHFDVEANRVVVITDGISALPALGPATDPATGHRLAGGTRYILAVGTVEPRKNLPGLAVAFDLVADHDPEVRLVIAGSPGWGSDALDATIATTRHRDRIVRLGWVDDRQRAALLRGAALLAYPSIYEGFGLPPLEAMSAGIPVVTTNAGSLPEILGDAAEFVDLAADDPTVMAAALTRILQDEPRRAALIAAGTAQASRYSWDHTAAELGALYRRLLGR